MENKGGKCIEIYSTKGLSIEILSVLFQTKSP